MKKVGRVPYLCLMWPRDANVVVLSVSTHSVGETVRIRLMFIVGTCGETIQTMTLAETHPSVETFAVGLGSNIGDRVNNIHNARKHLEKNGALWDFRHSELVESAPWGPIPQPPYVNAVSVFRTSLPAKAVLAECLRIERLLGRVRGERFGPRVLDLDLLLGSRTQMDDPDLILPHPRLHERAFVLLPLVAIWPDAWHVHFECTAFELWTRWKRSGVRVEDFVWEMPG